MSIFALTIGDGQLSAEQISAVQAALPNSLTLRHTTDQNELYTIRNEIEVIAGWFRPKFLLELPNLRWAQQWGAGADWLLRHPDVAAAPFVLTNVSGVHAIQISEHVLGMMLYFGRNFANATAAQRDRVWAKLKHPSEPLDSTPYDFSWDSVFELANKTILILGVGAIGARIAKLASAFDMRVIGIRNNPGKAVPFVDQMVGLEQLQVVLNSADFVINALPYTPATHHLLNEAAFACMKPNATVINIGRGASIDETALIKALQTGKIAAAGLDVVEQEPLSADSPLWEMPNVLLTSHYSGGSSQYHERSLAILLDNIARYTNNQPMRNVVNKQLGY